jgi:hypothetical protein
VHHFAVFSSKSPEFCHFVHVEMEDQLAHSVCWKRFPMHPAIGWGWLVKECMPTFRDI